VNNEEKSEFEEEAFEFKAVVANRPSDSDNDEAKQARRNGAHKNR